MTKISQFAAIGEAMIELSHQTEYNLHMSFAGDTINVATYLARQNAFTNVQVNYVTALGTDPYSELMLRQWQQENIKTELAVKLENKLPGLYLIRNDAKGERYLYFYRSQSAARELFKNKYTSTIVEKLVTMDYLYLSLITLAILDETSREQLLAALAQAKKNGAKIIFDSNYRPSLWPDKKTAQAIYQSVAKFVDIALPTLDDEYNLFDDKSTQACAERLLNWGINEIVIKRGGDACFIATANEQLEVPAEKVTQIIDTTSAGDSFNAGYLAARLQNYTPAQAAAIGHKLASVVITHKGAIIAADKMPKLF